MEEIKFRNAVTRVGNSLWVLIPSNQIRYANETIEPGDVLDVTIVKTGKKAIKQVKSVSIEENGQCKILSPDLIAAAI